MAKEECFIIAPISTPPDRVSVYAGDVDHCEHVLDHLLAPAVEKAGFVPVKPKAKGSELIHGEIVRNLQEAPFVLCDMSGLNPNVFFELGVRTAMNKPICLTIDAQTKKAPFDLAVINHHEYVHDLRPWVLPTEIDKLSEHIRQSAAKRDNALWTYFALRISAKPAAADSKDASVMDLILREMEGLRKSFNEREHLRLRGDPPLLQNESTREEMVIEAKARVLAAQMGLTVDAVGIVNINGVATAAVALRPSDFVLNPDKVRKFKAAAKFDGINLMLLGWGVDPDLTQPPGG